MIGRGDFTKWLLVDVHGQDGVPSFNIPRSLIDFTGDLETGFLLTQLLAWTEQDEYQDAWISKTEAAWQQAVYMKPQTIRRAQRRLSKMGILESRSEKAADGSTLLACRVIFPALEEKFRAWHAASGSTQAIPESIAEGEP